MHGCLNARRQSKKARSCARITSIFYVLCVSLAFSIPLGVCSAFTLFPSFFFSTRHPGRGEREERSRCPSLKLHLESAWTPFHCYFSFGRPCYAADSDSPPTMTSILFLRFGHLSVRIGASFFCVCCRQCRIFFEAFCCRQASGGHVSLSVFAFGPCNVKHYSGPPLSCMSCTLGALGRRGANNSSGRCQPPFVLLGPPIHSGPHPIAHRRWILRIEGLVPPPGAPILFQNIIQFS